MSGRGGRGKGEMTIDVLSLLDRLEALVNSGTRVPLTSKALIDEQEFLELVDQLRVAMPDEVRHAKRVNQDRDRVIAQAQLEADRTVAAARERAEQLIQESDLVRSAQQRADAVLRSVVEECRQLRADSDSYAMEVLEGLESELNRLLATVRKGKAALEKMRREDDSLDLDPGRDSIPENGSRTGRFEGKDTTGL